MKYYYQQEDDGKIIDVLYDDSNLMIYILHLVDGELALDVDRVADKNSLSYRLGSGDVARDLFDRISVDE